MHAGRRQHHQRPPRRRRAHPRLVDQRRPASRTTARSVARRDCHRHAAGGEPGRHRRHDGRTRCPRRASSSARTWKRSCSATPGQVAGNTTTARTLRSFNAWISGNGSRGRRADSTAATAATDGTAGDDPGPDRGAAQGRDQGRLRRRRRADPGPVGSFNKQLFSGFAGRAVQQTMVDNKHDARRRVDLHLRLRRPQGRAEPHPARRDVYVVDTTKVAVAFLRFRAAGDRPRRRCRHPRSHLRIHAGDAPPGRSRLNAYPDIRKKAEYHELGGGRVAIDTRQDCEPIVEFVAAARSAPGSRAALPRRDATGHRWPGPCRGMAGRSQGAARVVPRKPQVLVGGEALKIAICIPAYGDTKAKFTQCLAGMIAYFLSDQADRS
jgi:hypothetical protein